MKYNGIIDRKLRIIEEKLENIKSWEIDSFAKLQNSSLLQNAVERALQVAIESMIDVAERILSLENIPPQETATANMQKLQELGILDTQNKYLNMVKFRNFIVHRYEKIDLEIIYGILKKHLHLFRAFIDEIRNAK